MEQKLVCDTVKDLLPLYVDKLTSEASNQSIDEHIAECEDCRAALERMTEKLDVEVAPEVNDFKKYLNKSKWSIVYYVMGILAIIAIITCFIVNIAVELRLSWSLIVVGGIITAYLPAYTAIKSKKHKFIKMVAVFNVCAIFLLILIQAVVYNIMGIGSVWIWSIGLPIALLWSAIVWISILCNLIFKVNPLISLSVLCFLAVPANGLTNMLSGDYHSMADFTENFVANGLGNLLAAIVFLIIGIIIELEKKRKTK
ncbi:MAG: zf-HC2 domain-containing protein [Acutalibacteraceae bacterium]